MSKNCFTKTSFERNKESKGWTDSSKDSSLLVKIVDKPNLSESMISLVASSKNISISSSPNRSIPLDQHVSDTNSAKYLFKKSGRDFKINYFIDHKGLHENHASMDRDLFQYIENSFRSLKS